MDRRVRIGIDVGGTFTDLFLIREPDGLVVRHKLSSTPEDPYKAPIAGLKELLAKAKISPTEIDFIGLGTTVGTNALIERKGARTALVTTRGFRDVLENGRQGRQHVFNLHLRKPSPLVPRELRFEIDERSGSDGEIITPLDQASLPSLVERLKSLGVESVAVCFLNSYKNGVHEMECANFISSQWPDCPMSISSEVMPQFREFERVSTTVLNAYLMPLMQRYLMAFQEEVLRIGVKGAPFVMNSGGGVVSPGVAGMRPVDTLLSGPSGGVSGAAHLSRLAGHPNTVTFDMGGTSTDVSLLRDYRSELAKQRVIDGLPFKATSVDVHSIGAGGSSIAKLDEGGLLRVGPRSAGASPGPACYGKGGREPTVTDANVVLGRLNDKFLLGGQLPIDSSKSFAAVDSAIARPRKTNVEDAAKSIIAVANMNISEAIRFVSVSRGVDPRDFVLVAFGGAGPIHAAEVARELNMKGVLVPESPGVLCAMGVLTKDVRVDTSKTVLLRESQRDVFERLREVFSETENRAKDLLRASGTVTTDLQMERSVDIRYVGQNHELLVRLAEGDLNERSIAAIRKEFDALHKQLFGYDQQEKEIEIVTLHAAALIPIPRPEIRRPAAEGQPREPNCIARRSVFFSGSDAMIDTPIFERGDFQTGLELPGPAIIEQFDTTTLVPPDFTAHVDAQGNLYLTRR